MGTIGTAAVAAFLCLIGMVAGCVSQSAVPTASPRPTGRVPMATATPPASAESMDRDARWDAVDSWVYQLTGYAQGRLDEISASSFDLAVIDLARDGADDTFTRAEIRALQATGKIVLAYFEIGAIETYRPEWPEVPEDLRLGEVSGWPDEFYVAYWDERWWSVVEGRLDQALRSGFDGAYLDLVNAYEEIPVDAAETDRDDLAQRMVDLLQRISGYAKARDAGFRIVPQNAPELYLYPGYLESVDGLGMEELTVLATDRLCDAAWCDENRVAAAAVHAAGKLVLSVDYADDAQLIDLAYHRARDMGFVPYVTVVELDRIRTNAGWAP